MTQATRNGLIGLLEFPAVSQIDQLVMDLYLEPFASREDFETRASGDTHLLAVLATAEYHEHWHRIAAAATARPSGCDVHPVLMPGCFRCTEVNR